MPLIEHAPQAPVGVPRRLLIIPPLFEEMNRTRALLASLGRELAARNIVTLLPDLPGTGDCARQLADVGWTDWIDALRALVEVEKPDRMFAIRGGALLAQHLPLPRDDFAPIAQGQNIWRSLARARMVAAQEAGEKLTQAMLEQQSAEGAVITCAGYALSPAMLRGLSTAHIEKPAQQSWQLHEAGLDGPPVWLQAEPLPAGALAAQLAARLVQHWV